MESRLVWLPRTIIYDGYMYASISRQKEAIEILRFNLGQL